jgi:transposase-like protein
LDQLLENRDPRAVLSRDGLFDELKKALAERVLNAELDNHLTVAADGAKNRRQLMTGLANDHFAQHFITTRHREEFSFSSSRARHSSI